MVKIVFIFTLFYFITPNSAYPSTNSLVTFINEYSKYQEQGSNETQETWNGEDVAQACSDVGNHIAVQRFNGDYDQIEKVSYDKLFEWVSRSVRTSGYASFMLFNSTSARLAKAITHQGLLKGLEMAEIASQENYESEEGFLTLIDIYFDAFRKFKIKSNSIGSLFSSNEVKESLHPEPNSEHGKLLEQVFNSCDEFKWVNCRTSQIGRLVNIASIKYRNVPLAPEMTRFHASKEFLIRESTLFLLRLVRGVATGELKLQKSNILDDLINNLTLLKVDKKQATEFVWHFLGMYGTRGATFLSNGFLISPFHQLSLHILSLAISYLDKVQFKASQASYAFPKVFKTQCLYGKPYHFWMAAYIARYGRKQEYNSFSAFMASALLGAGYDLTADYNGRDPDAVFSDNAYSPTLNSKRIDNSWRTLGAYFGSLNSKLKNSNKVDSIIAATFNSAKPGGPKPAKDEEIQKARVGAWFRVVRPDQLIARLWMIR